MVKEFGIMQAPTLVITDGEHMTKYVNTSNIKKYVDVKFLVFIYLQYNIRKDFSTNYWLVFYKRHYSHL